MHIHFITVYYATDDLEVARTAAQEDLLRQWQESLHLCNIKVINKAKISFIDYALFDYPNQDLLKKKIDNSLNKSYNHLLGKQYWWFLGNSYEDFEIFYKDLAKTHQLMELIITVEEE